jgi:TatD DNase family protein
VFTDTHCHLYLNLFQEDLDAVLKRAWDEGLKRILIPGIDLDTSRQAVRLSEQHPNLFAAVGVHPNDCSGWNDSLQEELRKLASHPRVLAIGEIGLDYYRQYTPHSLQQRAFKDQLELAAELGLPVVIHQRNSWEDLWPLLQEWQEKIESLASPLAARPGVLHSFDGDLDRARNAITHHFYLGISGPVTFKNAQQRQDLVAALPVETLLTETDAPYLTPHPFRGRRNEPSFVTYVTRKIADLHNQPSAEIAEVTYQNAARLFQWDNFD